MKGFFIIQSTPPPPSAAVSPAHAWAPSQTLHPRKHYSACKEAWAVAWVGPRGKVPGGKPTAVVDHTLVVMTAAAAAADVTLAIAVADTDSAVAAEVQCSVVTEGLVVGIEEADIAVAAVAAADIGTETETDEEES